ncbi:YkyA family protein [Dolosicoccus paucivorans]|uniref:Cell-wall binding lipoprotein n=1 Tax=Dolosicoccus paucivorans TaxID=84521 RepID=A0A1G8MNS7_9LACT|nr:YkyA family protein [Dolosicoccus paucivorans]PMB85142.1 hypothetical protein CJ206_00240 [Dolosicoccus paucivorans]PMC58944.1 hypothetical protein CJ205_01885 [Dolosicoccus paucivorans]SDI69611.1 hypothetical protein SAMN04487994_10355 [Dolosicoccus paucivorans]
MKKITYVSFLLFITIFLVGCSKSLPRAERIIGLMQEEMTSLVAQLNELQALEDELQQDFESTLDQDHSLELFADTDSPIQQNVFLRKDTINQLRQTLDTILSLENELLDLKDKKNIPEDVLNTIHQEVNAMDEAMDIFLKDYMDNLSLEEKAFASVASDDSNFGSFFKVIEDINTLSTTNEINLDRAITHFEPLNTTLVNAKVELIHSLESTR